MEWFSLLFYFCIIIPSAMFHEYAHAWAADRLGDPTARYAGRLNLDPRVHIDLIGTILLPLSLFLFSGGRFLFAYAKPVPINYYNLKNGKRDLLLTALAGPASNFLIAVIFAVLARFLLIGNISIFLLLIVYANVLLAVFNLIPIPPLDGSKILSAVLPDRYQGLLRKMERGGGLVFILIFIIFLSPVVSYFTEAVFSWLTNVPSGLIFG